MHERNCFITLTYDDKHMPPGQTLVKKHLQDFYRSLRQKGFNFRYFSAGEYGEKTNRPHYHAILFGIDFHEDRRKHSGNAQGNTLFVSPTLTDTWSHGHCLIGSCNYQTAAYISRYVLKKITGKQADENYVRVNPSTGEIFHLLPEFALMSLKPGIGAAWYDKYKSDAFPSDFLVHQGKKHPVPRYYTNKLSTENATMHQAIKRKRKADQLDHSSESTPDRLAARETVKKSKINMLKRSL